MNRFKIIVTTYNNEDWVEYNVASILNQTYTNYEVMYVVDKSDDRTAELAKECIGDDTRFRLVINTEHKGGTYNATQHIDEFDVLDEDIIVRIDGDDWLYDENVLQKLSDFYDKGYWMSYGGFVCWDGNGEGCDIPFPQSAPYPEFVSQHKLYRRDLWRASHMRTFKGFLHKALDKNDYISPIDGKLVWHAGDLAEMYPLLEMCPADKIGLVDFYTYVYNQAKGNAVRTAEREVADNQKYEIEIRNRKTYVEGLSGKKLPQICAWHSYWEYHQVPSKFTFCYNQFDGEYDMVLLDDVNITRWLAGEIKVNRNVPVVARVAEHRDYFGRNVFNIVKNNADKFAAILTYDEELLKLPNAIMCNQTEVSQFNALPNPHGVEPYKSDRFTTHELPSDAFQIYPKSKMVSCVASSKSHLPGHVRRLKFIDAICGKTDMFGRGRNPIPSKIDALCDYRFSVAIENIIDTNSFTEKITDCFLTGTVPIYYGCPNIGDIFDKRGILTFDTIEELLEILDNLTEEKYESMKEAIETNYRLSFGCNLTNDIAYELYYKDIINGKNSNR